MFKYLIKGLKSYRDLPLRISEFGKVHRYEPSGALHGLLRVRAFTQDDAHIFCTEDQITEECLIVTNLILDIYKDLGFENVILKYSDRPDLRVGDDKFGIKLKKLYWMLLKHLNLNILLIKVKEHFMVLKLNLF